VSVVIHGATKIDADGIVNASVLHDSGLLGPNPCNWHVFIRLMDWIDGAMAIDENFPRV